MSDAQNLEDTQPRRILLPDEEESPPSGCGNTLLIGTIALFLLFMFVAVVGLAGVAGWRDGGIARQTQRAVALAGTLEGQLTLAAADLANQQYSLARGRCQYILAQQPFNRSAAECLSTAQAGLLATATPTPAPPTVTPTAPPETPMPTLSGAFTPEELFARGQEAMRRSDWESAMSWLEALRALDGTFRRREVEDMLVTVYQALGNQYRFEGRLSEMVVVIEKALKIRALPDTDWQFTINATKLYLSARGYLDAGNFALAAQVFATLMEIAPNYLNTRELACRAFNAAGDSANVARFCR
jgi:tetratricopeptide (TPR) repeat protein